MSRKRASDSAPPVAAAFSEVGASVDSSDYGYGTYDKSTVAKTARVVVTIDCNIEH